MIYHNLLALKMHLYSRYDLKWYEYMILVAIDRGEQLRGYGTIKDITGVKLATRPDAYKYTNILTANSMMSFEHRSFAWDCNKYRITTKGKVVLNSSNRILRSKSK